MPRGDEELLRVQDIFYMVYSLCGFTILNHRDDFRVVFTISMLRKLCHRYLHFNLTYITDLETLVDILKGEIEGFVVENLHCGYLKAEVNSTFSEPYLY